MCKTKKICEKNQRICCDIYKIPIIKLAFGLKIKFIFTIKQSEPNPEDD